MNVEDSSSPSSDTKWTQVSRQEHEIDRSVGQQRIERIADRCRGRAVHNDDLSMLTCTARHGRNVASVGDDEGDVHRQFPAHFCSDQVERTRSCARNKDRSSRQMRSRTHVRRSTSSLVSVAGLVNAIDLWSAPSATILTIDSVTRTCFPVE